MYMTAVIGHFRRFIVSLPKRLLLLALGFFYNYNYYNYYYYRHKAVSYLRHDLA